MVTGVTVSAGEGPNEPIHTVAWAPAGAGMLILTDVRGADNHGVIHCLPASGRQMTENEMRAYCRGCRDWTICLMTYGSLPPGQCSGHKRSRLLEFFDSLFSRQEWYRRLRGGEWISYWLDMHAEPFYLPAKCFRAHGYEHAIHSHYYRGAHWPVTNKFNEADR